MPRILLHSGVLNCTCLYAVPRVDVRISRRGSVLSTNSTLVPVSFYRCLFPEISLSPFRPYHRASRISLQSLKMQVLLSLITVWIHLSSTVLAQSYPYYLTTIKGCSAWFNNSGDYTYTKIRDILHITPANFTR
ncbi:hypothetical protein BKA65DRAFT_142185 [Rhexocercosporidium sp. MPI-PUGE-AT-0058]|nr:hypothetical protein BKA65DRAFT_142185 [Rhexocercosporidium sp. MPI-PUGE-AT-0058]